MKTYPVMLKMENRIAVVVGCGQVGTRKARGLVDAGAKVRLVCGDANPGDIEGVEVILEPYNAAHLDGAFMVFACTDDSQLNSRIVSDARRIGSLANAADQPDDCDLYSPAVIRHGEVTIAIGTGGASPGLVRLMKSRIGEVLPDNLGEFAELLEAFRAELKQEIDNPEERMRIMRLVSNEEAYSEFNEKGRKALRQRFDNLKSGGENVTESEEKRIIFHPLTLAGMTMVMLLVLWGFAAHYNAAKLPIGHRVMAALSMLLLMISAGAGVLYLRTERGMKRHDASLLLGSTPSLEKLDHTCRTGLTYGFCFFTVAVVLGIFSAIQHSSEKWFYRWVTHPKMTGAVIAWVILALAFTAAWAPRFRGRRTAALSISGFVLSVIVVVISYLVVEQVE